MSLISETRLRICLWPGDGGRFSPRERYVKELNVRRATVVDAEGIATVRVQTWQAAYRGLVPDSYLDGMSLDDNIMRATAWFDAEALGTHWVCTIDNEVVGWACAFMRARDADLCESVAELVACYAMQRVWGFGVGFEMWKTVVAELRNRGAHAVALWVLAKNDRAIQFYERQGFQADGATKTEVLAGCELKEIRLVAYL